MVVVCGGGGRTRNYTRVLGWDIIQYMHIHIHVHVQYYTSFASSPYCTIGLDARLVLCLRTYVIDEQAFKNALYSSKPIAELNICLLCWLSTQKGMYRRSHTYIKYTVWECLYISVNSEALHTLDLSWNHLQGKGATALAAGLKVSLHLLDGGVIVPPNTHCLHHCAIRI